MTDVSSGGAFLYAGALGLGAGVAFTLLFAAGFLLPAFLLGCAVVLLSLYALCPNKKIILGAVTLCTIVLGIARADIFLQRQAQQDLVQYAGGTAQIQGVVISDPDVRDTSVRANISVTNINGASLPSGRQGVALAVFSADTALSYGDHVEVQGTLVLPQAFAGDNGNLFDYPAYLRLRGVSVVMQPATLVSDHAGAWSLYGILFSFKHLFNNSVDRVLPQPESSLIEGILLGERHGLPADLTQMLVLAGLIHIIILSGYSMSVIGESVLRGLGFLPKTPRFIIGGALLILFVMLTGAAATTVRACSMALIGLLARYFGRSSVALRSLAVVSAAMVLWNPLIILYDSSFIVSVLATFGLITLAPWIEAHLPQVLERFPGLRSIITSTMSVQIFALPALLYFTGNISFLSVPANLVVLPFLPFVMLAGLVTGVLGFVSTPLAFVPGIITFVFLRCIILVATIVSVIPFSAITVTAFPLWAAATLYIPLTWFALRMYKAAAK